MPKNIQDIITNEKKKSIRDIPIPDARRRSAPPSPMPVGDSVARANTGPRPGEGLAPEDMSEPQHEHSLAYHDLVGSRPKKKKLLGKKTVIIGLLVLIVAAFGLMSVFAGATLTYTPKSEMLSFAGEGFSAKKSGEGALMYSVVKLTGEKGMPVAASGSEQVERKASGTIVVYNNSGTAAQPLVENTRFESPDGKVYRIAAAISVPGRKTVAGETQPGSVEVTVYADEPGEAYNVGLTDFTLPGLEGTAKFSTVYARSKTPMTGGFVGMEKQVDEATLSSASDSLEAALAEELAAQAKAQVPGEYILFSSLSSMDFEEMPQSDVTDTGVTVNLRGNFYGVMFKRSDLSHALAAKKIDLSEDEDVMIENLDLLDVAFQALPPADLLGSTEINFSVRGDANLVWQIDEDVLKSDLAGKAKKEAPSILTNYPSVVEADAVVRPFWKKSFPDNPSEITIKRVLSSS